MLVGGWVDKVRLTYLLSDLMLTYPYIFIYIYQDLE